MQIYFRTKVYNLLVLPWKTRSIPCRSRTARTPVQPTTTWALDERKRVAEKDPARGSGAWRKHEPHGSQRPDFSSFLPPPRQILATISPPQPVDPSSSLFLTLGGRKEDKKSAFYPSLFQEQTNFTGFPRNQDGDIEEAAYNNKPLRPRLLCPSITSCVCRSQASPANLVWGAERGELADQRWSYLPLVSGSICWCGRQVWSFLGAIVVIDLWTCGRQWHWF